MRRHLDRRSFLTAGALAVLGRSARLRAQAPAAAGRADVVVIGGDPAAFSAAWRLSRTGGVAVTLVDDRPAWLPAPLAPPASIAALPPFVRGHQVCFDSWRDFGNAGWGYADVLPVFKRLEKYEAGETEYRGGSGPVPVAHCWDPHPLHRLFLQSAVSGGFQQDSRHDFNGPRSQSIAGYYQKTTADDRPVSLAEALLDPAAAAGVTVVRGTAVNRLVIEKGRAVGVELVRGGSVEVLRADRGVLLAAAPVRCAQILLLSGIGPAAHLRERGLPVVADRAGVGRNLQAHVRLPMRWDAKGMALTVPESTVSAGMFTVSLNASPPDLQWDFLDPRAAGAPVLGIDITLVQPASRGEVRLRSTNPSDAPEVAWQTLAAEADVTALVQGVRLARLTAGSAQLDAVRGDETAATRGPTSQADLQALVKTLAVRVDQTAGTCAMGAAGNAAAVVDRTLAVHGVPGLHVAGPAVMPVVVNAPTAAASIMIGDRAAEFLLAAKG